MDVESVHKIDGKEVVKIGHFSGFELYQYDDADLHGGSEIITYFVKKQKVVGRTKTEYSGGAECSASASVTFQELSTSGKWTIT